MFSLYPDVLGRDESTIQHICLNDEAIVVPVLNRYRSYRPQLLVRPNFKKNKKLDRSITDLGCRLGGWYIFQPPRNFYRFWTWLSFVHFLLFHCRSFDSCLTSYKKNLFKQEFHFFFILNLDDDYLMVHRHDMSYNFLTGFRMRWFITKSVTLLARPIKRLKLFGVICRLWR